MRKLFWGCLAGGVLIFGSVFTLTQIAVRHPNSLIGRIMHGSDHAATVVNPYAGFTPLLAKLEREERLAAAQESGETPPVEGIPDDPVPVQDSEPPLNLAPIVIPDEEPTPIQQVQAIGEWKPMPIGEPLVPVQHTGTFQPGTECPPSAITRATPSLMPYCEEECEEGIETLVKPIVAQLEKLHMPKACSECEKLGMPHVEEEQEPSINPDDSAPEQECSCPLGGVAQLLRLFEKAVKKACHTTPINAPASEATDPPACREDGNHHHHYSGTPCTGSSCSPCTRSSYKPVIIPVTPKLGQGEEESEPTDGATSLLRKLLDIKNGVKKGAKPVRQKIDTMEYRQSDRPLSDFGPGRL